MFDTHFNQNKADSFAEKLIGILNDGALALMISVGHRTGLFDVMQKLAPSTPAQIATFARLNERYVREWLDAMVTGRIVDFNPENKTYRLPAEHAVSLTRTAAPNNMAVSIQWIPLLASVEDEIVERFRTGGGVPYSSYKRFHEVMAEESDQTTLSRLNDAILPLVEGLKEKLEAGIDVMEVGCGSGRALNLLAKTYPNSRFTGYDLSSEGLFNACEEAERFGLNNVSYEIRDVTSLNARAQYDLVLAFDAVHDQAAPAVVLKNIADTLRADATFLMQEIGGSSHVHHNLEHPIAPFLYTISCLHCMTVSLSAGGQGLGAMWGEETARAMLKDAGFDKIEVHKLPHDFINYYYVIRKD